MSDQDKDVEILVLRHQITVLERELGNTRPRFSSGDRAFLTALLHRLPVDTLRRRRLLVRPETVLRWHRDLLARRHAARSRPKRPGRPPTIRSIRLLARENPTWGYRRIHGELLVLGIKIAASTVWQILQNARDRPGTRTHHDDLDGLPPLTGRRTPGLRLLRGLHVAAPGCTYSRTAPWVTQAARNFVMDLEDSGSPARFLIRARDSKFPALFDALLADAGNDWAARNPRITLHFTPTSDSWLNLVEVFFGIITRQAIRRRSFNSVKELAAAIRGFINGWNDRCHPFTWAKTADQILPHTTRQRTSDARH
ncbi:hypothetical protein GCM10027184_25310 [Saccharothrix stipae]